MSAPLSHMAVFNTCLWMFCGMIHKNHHCNTLYLNIYIFQTNLWWKISFLLVLFLQSHWMFEMLTLDSQLKTAIITSLLPLNWHQNHHSYSICYISQTMNHHIAWWWIKAGNFFFQISHIVTMHMDLLIYYPHLNFLHIHSWVLSQINRNY